MRYQEFKTPLFCQIELTPNCDNNCLHCYNYWRHGESNEKKQKEMSRNLLDATIEQIINCEVLDVVLTGGEPLLAKENLLHAVAKFSSCGIAVSINSNLTMMTSDIARELSKVPNIGILTSLCGENALIHDFITKSPGSFDKTILGIMTARAHGINVAINMVVSKSNINSIVNTGLLAKELEASYFYATKASTPLNSVNFGDHRLSKNELIQTLDDLKFLSDNYGIMVGALESYPLCLYLSQKKYPFIEGKLCRAGITACVISSDGSIKACNQTSNNYGSIQTNGLRKSWKLMKEWRSTKLLSITCQKCNYLVYCSGGCIVDAHNQGCGHCAIDSYAEPCNIDKIEIMERSAPKISIHSSFRVEKLKFRSERFGVICANALTPYSISILTFDTVELIKSLEGKIFTPQDIAEITGISTADSIDLCSNLLLHEYIIFETKKGGDFDEARFCACD